MVPHVCCLLQLLCSIAGSVAQGEPGASGERNGWLSAFDVNGFIEERAGSRIRDNKYEDGSVIGEARFQLKLQRDWDSATLRMTSDLLYDPVLDRHDIKLERGEGWLDLRELSVTTDVSDFMNVKAGRQPLSWGTGNLLFINDMFSKDWNSFFIGRDLEYLKAPSDAVKISAYSDTASLNIAYMPRFDPDRFIDGRRISYWNPILQREAGTDVPVKVIERDAWIDDDEVAVRIYGDIEGIELAVYGYSGFWKSPAGYDEAKGLFTFPELSVYGASARGSLFDGIANAEIGIYDSRDDRSGDDSLIPNSEFRALAGYEQEIATELTAGVQLYLEQMFDYSRYKRTLPAGSARDGKNRVVATLELVQMLENQDLRLSVFGYYSPTDTDSYVLVNARYKFDDYWSIDTGANVFSGRDAHTFFGQFEPNSNFYLGVRYSF